MHSQRLLVPANHENFDEAAYLRANPDVAAAVKDGSTPSGRAHFEAFGLSERRKIRLKPDHAVRTHKLDRVRPLLSVPPQAGASADLIDTLTPELRDAFRIIDTDNVSAHEYDQRVLDLITRHASGLVLDCGAGLRNSYFPHVVNYEIVAYDTTDVLGVAECLPFKDGSFDAVISLNVLEHVKDPFRAASELMRVLKPGGELICCVPFLQPLHGYPHHYYNMTHEGLLNLFEGMSERSIDVYGATRPLWALSWILQRYEAGLPESERARFRSLRVEDLMKDPRTWEADPIVAQLSRETNLELAAGCVLEASKPSGHSAA